MGRPREHSHHEGCNRLELSSLLDAGLLKADQDRGAVLSWTDGSSLSVYSKRKDFIVLDYSIAGQSIKYKIDISAVPSNLGRGDVLYFSCPQTARRCRILYRTYGSRYYKSRHAYANRIYYRSQIYNGANDNYFRLEAKISRMLNSQRYQETYNGERTQWIKRIERMTERLDHLDDMRFSSFISQLKSAINY